MNWFIKAANMVYGPYSIERMTQFAQEGRLGLKTLVSDNRDKGFLPATQIPEILEILAQKQTASDNRQALEQNRASANLGKFILHVGVSEDAREQFVSALHGFGDAFEPEPGLWAVRTQASCDNMRNALSKLLGAHDHLLIFEIKDKQSAWFNIGEEKDRKFRSFLS